MTQKKAPLASSWELVVEWIYNHHLLPPFVFGWWLDRRCRVCGQRRYAHPFGRFGDRAYCS